MASDLLTIATSGVRTARSALDVTAQNIANADSDGYVRRTVRTAEVSAASGLLRASDMSLSGVRIEGVYRNADMFRQADVRRTSSDAARAAAELQGYENIEIAIEQAQPYNLLVEFEASMQALSADPTDPSLRAAMIGAASSVASSFNIASSSLDAVGDGLRFEAVSQIDEANVVGAELARVNLHIARAGAGSSDSATLLDQRDNLLMRLSGIANISANFEVDGTVEVSLGGAGGEVFVQGASSGTLSAAEQADGTLAYSLDGTALSFTAGSLSGKALALEAVAQNKTRLDDLANGIAATVNAAQLAGIDANDAAGQPIFTSTGASDLALAFTDGHMIAAAYPGSTTGSADGSNLLAMIRGFETADHAGATNSLLFGVSADVASRKVTTEALQAIASSSRIALDEQSGVDLDQEAASLVRYQQAFEASSRAMQVASDIFDILMGIGR